MIIKFLYLKVIENILFKFINININIRYSLKILYYNYKKNLIHIKIK